MTQKEAVIAAFKALGGDRSAKEVQNWVTTNIKLKWKDYNTTMADMVSLANGGNASSTVPEAYRVLERVSTGTYRLKKC